MLGIDPHSSCSIFFHIMSAENVLLFLQLLQFSVMAVSLQSLTTSDDYLIRETVS